MTGPVPPTHVPWEPRPKPHIAQRCDTCARSWGAVGPWLDGWITISPAGIEHIGLASGQTACGADATDDAWWWAV